MSLDGPRTSVFTFQSAVHSLHVLRALDQQRQMDVLCDVTVVVDNKRFRAHCSVLASCSDFFKSRVTNHSYQNPVLTLPDEVTAEGFEPLLEFAYTAKLHFTKENIHEIHRCAEFLGFHNLNQACFDFFLPKSSNHSTETQEDRGRGHKQGRGGPESSPSSSADHCASTQPASAIVDDHTGAQQRADATSATPATPASASADHSADSERCANLDDDVDAQQHANAKFASGSEDLHTDAAQGANAVPASGCVDHNVDIDQYANTMFASACVDHEGARRHDITVPKIASVDHSMYTNQHVNTVLNSDSLYHNTATAQQADAKSADVQHQLPKSEEHHRAPSSSLVECPEVSDSAGEDMQIDLSQLCPKSPSFHLGSSQDQFCLENCGPELLSSSSVSTGGVCPFLSMPCPGDNDSIDPAAAGCSVGVMEMGSALQNDTAGDASAPPSEPSATEETNLPESSLGPFDQPNSDCGALCPLNSAEASEVLESMASAAALEGTEAGGSLTFGSAEEALPTSPAKESSDGGRSREEREVAEHLAKGLWTDLGSSLAEPQPVGSRDPTDSPSAAGGADFHWLKHLDLGAAPDDCPFLRDLSSNGSHPSGGADGQTPPAEASPCVSPIRSGENSSCDSGDDSEVSSGQVCEVELPFPVELISSLSRRAFLQMLKTQPLTPDQLEFVQDVRRRSKNRVAAQRCRKRKLDCIHRLESEIKRLSVQKERLLQERSHMKQRMEETVQSLSGLCQSIGDPSDPAHPPLEQLRAPAQCVSPHPQCTPSALLTPMASPNLPASDREPRPGLTLSGGLAEHSADQTPTTCADVNPTGIPAETDQTGI